jgi:hypothetical protein
MRMRLFGQGEVGPAGPPELPEYASPEFRSDLERLQASGVLDQVVTVEPPEAAEGLAYLWNTSRDALNTSNLVFEAARDAGYGVHFVDGATTYGGYMPEPLPHLARVMVEPGDLEAVRSMLPSGEPSLGNAHARLLQGACSEHSGITADYLTGRNAVVQNEIMPDYLPLGPDLPEALSRGFLTSRVIATARLLRDQHSTRLEPTVTVMDFDLYAQVRSQLHEPYDVGELRGIAARAVALWREEKGIVPPVRQAG